jgi:hypothetical protein
MWYGITDRMQKSMCTFHDRANLAFEATPHTRHKSYLWNESDIAQMRAMETASYLVSRAAHAILNIRMARLCRKLLETKDNPNTNNKLDLPGSCCANYVFDESGSIIEHVLSTIL